MLKESFIRNKVSYTKQSKGDNEIVQELAGGSASTFRNHRFTLREKHEAGENLSWRRR